MNVDGVETESSIYTTTSTIEWSEPCRRFEFDEILSATGNFDESLVIGQGGFGKVYKGNLVSGSTTVVAAIKRRYSTSYQGLSEFSAEVETLSKLRHTHIVSLIGYCEYETELILVYEYIPNGTLYEHLHIFCTLLSWLQRLKICIDVARGLDILHNGKGSEFCIVHLDVKSSDILLNKSWAAKIADFGFSKTLSMDQQSIFDTIVRGTFGYVDPHYVITGDLSRKSDVYSFGVVLLEVLCRKMAVDNTLDITIDEENSSLVRWAQSSIKEGRLNHIIDPDIRDEISPKCLKKFVQMVERCLDDHPEHRPTCLRLSPLLNLYSTYNRKPIICCKWLGRQSFIEWLISFRWPPLTNTRVWSLDFTFLRSGSYLCLEEKSSRKVALCHL
ncbi:hypothetical protein R6Q59_023133 [Mikania micrantha]